MAELEEQPGGGPPQAQDEELERSYVNQNEAPVEPGAPLSPPQKKPPFLLLAVGVVIVAALAVAFLATKNSGGSTQAKSKVNDLGQGVSADAGVRGHLTAEWQGNAAHYKLKIEPIAFPEADGFARVTSGNAQPIYFNLRILDMTGNAVCGKQVLLLPDGGKPPAGADAAKRVIGIGKRVDALWAEGTLPCSPAQYQQFNYWDFSTDFPSVAAQDRLLGIAPPTVAPDSAPPQTQVAAAARPARAAARQRAAKKPQSAFFLQGDDRVTAFEPGRNVLTIGPGKSFVVLRATDLQTAAAWAEDAALVHYTCDQHATCALRRSGSGVAVLARMNN